MSKTLMIGLDGATFSVLGPLMDDGVMPFLREAVARGVRADLLSTRNPLTPPAWISIVTGREPTAHGIHDFLRPEVSDEGKVFLRMNDSRDIRVETVWSMASRQGKRVTSLNFFGMSPPIPVDGYMISGFVPWRHLRQATHPPAFLDDIKEMPGFDYKMLGMDIGEEKKCVQGLLENEHEDWVQLQRERDGAWAQVLEHLMKTDATDLSAVVLDGPDKLQHLLWRFVDPDLLEPEPSEWFTKIRGLCLEYYRELDARIKRLTEIAGQDTTVILTSDHGFGPTTEVVYLNEWLSQNGYLRWAEERDASDGGTLTAEKMRDHLGTIDWESTVAFCPTPSSNAIYIKMDTGAGKGVKPEEYLGFCVKLRESLLAFRGPDGERVFTEVHLNRLEGIPYTEHTPDITVKLRDGGFVSILKGPEGAVVTDRPHADGTHRPNGIFVAWGPKIAKGKTLPPLSLLDVTPLILHLLGLPVPKDLDGRVPEEIFEAGAEEEVRMSGSTQAMSATSSKREPTEEEKEALLRQMKVLGYME